MAADELGSGVDDDVSAMLDGTDQVRGAEGIIDDQRQAVLVRDGCKMCIRDRVKPQLVTYQQNTTALGRTAADKLIELIEHPRVTLPEQIRVSGKLLDGGSVSIL